MPGCTGDGTASMGKSRHLHYYCLLSVSRTRRERAAQRWFTANRFRKTAESWPRRGDLRRPRIQNALSQFMLGLSGDEENRGHGEICAVIIAIGLRLRRLREPCRKHPFKMESKRRAIREASSTASKRCQVRRLVSGCSMLRGGGLLGISSGKEVR